MPPFDVYPENLKTPPQSAEAEAALLSAVFERNSLIDELEDILSERYFYRREHQIIFRRMSAMALQGHPIDPAVLAGYLDTAGELDQAGGAEYLIDLATGGRGSSNARHYAMIVRDRWLQRQLIAKGQKITDAGFEAENISEAIQEAQAEIMDFEQSTNATRTLREQLKSLVDRIEFLHNHKGQITGLETGYTDLDKRLGGLQKTNLIIIAGRPGQGKTTAAMNMAEHAAITGKNVLVFSLEMSSDELLMRSACSIGRIDHGKLSQGEIDDAWPNVNAFMQKISTASLTIDDRPVLTSEQAFSRARKVVRQTGRPLDLILVDYIQLMSDKGDELQKITNITRNLKLLAKAMNCPVVALSQLNRKCEERPNKRPLMSDLRSSGSIEQDADIIVFVYRDEYYNDNSEQKGIAELDVAKFRSGRTGRVYMASKLNFCRFDNLTNYTPPPAPIKSKRGGFEYV
jgi:replicative DNA helicase